MFLKKDNDKQRLYFNFVRYLYDDNLMMSSV